METQLAPQIFVIPQKMLQKQSLLKVASPAIAPAAAAPKYRVILSDSNKINRVQINNKIQIAKSKPVATVVGCKRPAAAVSPPCLSPKADIKIEDEDDDDSQAPMRKRANLDHLSAEERMQRRKLKNRVAAQNARDKKKAQTEEMEKLLDQMRAEKDALVAENARLQAFNNQLQIENASLIEENTEYKQKLGLITVNGSDIQQVQIELPMSPASLPPLSPISSPSPSSPVSVSPLSVSSDHSMVPPESAVLTYEPQQQEQGIHVAQKTTSPSLAPGLSSPDLTPWVQNCVVTLSCVLVTIMMILRQSSTSVPMPSTPSPQSLSPSHLSASSITLPLKKRNWTCLSLQQPKS